MNWPTTDDGIVDMILGHEGKTFTDLPADPGGATKFGIDLATLRAWRKDQTLTGEAVKTLEEGEARAIYRSRYISGPGFDAIAALPLRAFVCDTAVLFGPVHATRMLQNAVGAPQNGDIKSGDTIAKANAAEARGLVNAIAVERIVEHAMEVAQRPAKLVFLRGWVKRAAEAIS